MRYVDALDRSVVFTGVNAGAVVRAMARAAWMNKDDKGPYMREVARRLAPTVIVEYRNATVFLASLVTAGLLAKEEEV